MSILIKGINSSSGGGSSKGYPPGNVTDVEIKGLYKKVVIKWTEPNAIVLGGKTLVDWKSTVIVRKEGSAPTSIKDGVTILTNTTKNKYKDIYYEDQLSIKETTYYYRFFVLSADDTTNNDSGMIYTANPITNVDPVLKNNTWENITKVSESGSAPNIWKVGDEIDVNFTKTSDMPAQTLTLQIWDFNHFDKSDGSGKAGICFGMKDLMLNSVRFYYSNYCSTGYSGSSAAYTFEEFYKQCLEEVKPYIKLVTVYHSSKTVDENESSSVIGLGYSLDVHLCVPGYTEVFGPNERPEITETEQGQKQFPIFTDNNSRIKKIVYNSNNASSYALRTVGNASIMYQVSESGTPGASIISSDGTYGYACLLFNI